MIWYENITFHLHMMLYEQPFIICFSWRQKIKYITPNANVEKDIYNHIMIQIGRNVWYCRSYLKEEETAVLSWG